MIKTYSEMILHTTFLERFRYLQIGGIVGAETFGFDRYLNQSLYRTAEWKRFRNEIIVRDNGCDLGCDDREIHGKILVHHINPISADDIVNRHGCVFDPDNVVCVSLDTHNAIHYGDEDLLMLGPIERKPNDTCPWRR